VYRDVEYRPWKGQWYPEKLEIENSVVSEARILGLRNPGTFLVGKEMTIKGTVRNAGSTPMPSQVATGPGFGWNLTVKIHWSNGRETSLPTRFTEPLQPGESVEFGPFHPKVEAPGFFRIELTHPSSFVLRFPGETSESGEYGTEGRPLYEDVAVDMSTLYKKWGFWVSLVVLGVSLGVAFGFIRK